MITENYIYICDSKARDIFLGILYGYKMLLQIIAILLAFSIRKVKVKGLDDAKYIGAIACVTIVMLAVIIVATYFMKDVINGFTALFCTGFWIISTLVLILVFLPLVCTYSMLVPPLMRTIILDSIVPHFLLLTLFFIVVF